MSYLTSAPLQRTARTGPPAAPAPAAAPAIEDSVFWPAALEGAATAVAGLCPLIDGLSQRIGALQLRPALTRPVVGQYLTMVRTLAAAWGARTRPALLAAMGSLSHFGDSVCQAAALEALAGRRADRGRAALRALDALQRRLAAPLAAFGALDADVASYLRQMAGISAELDADTVLVTGRLQADYVHAFLLSQQASTLQGRLDDARMREQAPWAPGPHASALRQEICLHASALEGVRRQLDQLRAEQAATQAEADYLQSLLPGVSAYLAAFDRAGAAIGALAGACRALAQGLAALQEAIERDPGAVGGAERQMHAALPGWRELAAAAAAAATARPAMAPTTPGATRT